MSEFKGTNSAPRATSNSDATPAPNSSVNQRPLQNTQPPVEKTTSSAHPVHEKPTINFHSSTLDQTKVATRENPFAVQNRRTAEEKAKKDKLRKKSLIISAIVAGILLLIGLITLIIFLINRPVEQPGPMINDATSDLINKAQNILDNTDNLENAENVFNNAETTVEENVLNGNIDDTEAKRQLNEINIGKLQFYQNNNEYNKVIDTFDNIDMSITTNYQKNYIYNALFLSYGATGDQEKSMEYYNLMMELSLDVE